VSVNAAPLSGANWVVLKFGGTSVSTRPRWDKIAAIAKGKRTQGKHVLIVVSALSGTTDKLKAICDGHADAGKCRAVADEIIARHRAMFAELELKDAGGLDAWLAKLEQLLADPRRAEGALTWQAEVLALGEMMSSTLGAAYLSASGLPTQWLDSRQHRGFWQSGLSHWCASSGTCRRASTPCRAAYPKRCAMTT